MTRRILYLIALLPVAIMIWGNYTTTTNSTSAPWPCINQTLNAADIKQYYNAEKNQYEIPYPPDSEIGCSVSIQGKGSNEWTYYEFWGKELKFCLEGEWTVCNVYPRWSGDPLIIRPGPNARKINQVIWARIDPTAMPTSAPFPDSTPIPIPTVAVGEQVIGHKLFFPILFK